MLANLYKIFLLRVIWKTNSQIFNDDALKYSENTNKMLSNDTLNQIVI